MCSDRFCKNLNQRSLTTRWPLTPHLLRSYVWLYPRIIVSKSHENTSKYVDTVTFFAKNLNQRGHWPLDDLWPHICWGHMCDSTQGSLYPSPMKIHQSMWIQWPFLQKLEPRSLTPRWPLTPHLLRSHVWFYPRIIVSKSHGNTSMYVDTVINFANYKAKVVDPQMTFDPTSVEVLCVTLPKNHCVQFPWKYIKVCGYSDLFCKKKLNQRSWTPRWPLTPHLLRSHVWLYPRIIVSKSHENTSKYVDTVTLFAKTWTKGHWPLDEVSADAKRKKSACTIKVVDSLAYAHTLCCVPPQALCECYFCIQNQWSHSLRRDRKSGALLPSDSDWIYTVRLKGCAWYHLTRIESVYFSTHTVPGVAHNTVRGHTLRSPPL